MAHAWQNNSFARRIEITVPAPDANVTQFPSPMILDGLGITDAEIVDGEWAFYDHDDALLHDLGYGWEKETFVQGAGPATTTGVIWFAVDLVNGPAGEENHVWFYYNKTAGATPDNHTTEAWDPNYVGVYHMGDAGPGAADSTSNGNDLAEGNAPTYGQTGQVGACMLFDDASTEYLHKAAWSGVTGTAFTITGWMKRDTLTQNHCLASLADVDAGYYHALWAVDSGSASKVCARSYSASGLHDAITSTGMTVNTWHHLAAVHAAGDASRIAYLDGGNSGSDANSSQVVNIDHFTVGITADSTPAFPMSGWIDEVRISNIARDTEWVKHEFTVVDTGLAYAAIENIPAAGGALLLRMQTEGLYVGMPQ